MSEPKENSNGSEEAVRLHTPAEHIELPLSSPSDERSVIPTGPDTTDLLISLCSFQGFGPDVIMFHAGDAVKPLDLHESGWCKVQQLSDDVIATVPHGFFVSIVYMSFKIRHSFDLTNKQSRLSLLSAVRSVNSYNRWDLTS
jgi:hypothetical protein